MEATLSGDRRWTHPADLREFEAALDLVGGELLVARSAATAKHFIEFAVVAPDASVVILDRLVAALSRPDRPKALDRVGFSVVDRCAALTALHALDLPWSAADLAKLAHDAPALTSLSLRGSLIGAEGARAIAQLTSLTNLDLWVNLLGDEGAWAIAQLTNLTNLNLRVNQIGDEGARAIAGHRSLSGLDLSSNQITSLDPFIDWFREGLVLHVGSAGLGIRVGGNPLSRPPMEIASAGSDAVINYLDDLGAQGIAHL